MTVHSDDLPITDELLDRYVAGECTPRDSQRIQRWLEDQPSMRELVAELRSDESSPRSSNDLVDAEWRRVQRMMSGVTSSFGGRAVGAKAPAAAWGPSSRNLLGALGLVTAAALTVVAVRSDLFNRPQSETAAREYVTRIGERATVTLDDGSHVMLGPSSSLVVTHTGAQGRQVALQGTGFFTIANSSASPFIVTTGRARVRVLGTEFGVRNYAGEPSVTVAVRAGRVSIADTNSASAASPPLVAAANDVAHIDAQGASVRRGQDVDNLLAWTQGRLVFHNAPLSLVRAELARWYDVSFQVTDPALDSLPITGGFSDQSANELPQTLSFILPVRVSISGRVITISAR